MLLLFYYFYWSQCVGPFKNFSSHVGTIYRLLSYQDFFSCFMSIYCKLFCSRILEDNLYCNSPHFLALTYLHNWLENGQPSASFIPNVSLVQWGRCIWSLGCSNLGFSIMCSTPVMEGSGGQQVLLDYPHTWHEICNIAAGCECSASQRWSSSKVCSKDTTGCWYIRGGLSWSLKGEYDGTICIVCGFDLNMTGFLFVEK